MGRDHSLTDGFPSVVINGRKYRYGRDATFGEYLVENADPMCAKDYWCFARQEDLLAFLINLPESADRDAFIAAHPDWHDVTHEQRLAYMEERDAKLRRLAEEKRKAGTADLFQVLRFDTEGAGYGEAYAGIRHFSTCDDVELYVREHEDPGTHGKERLIELCTVPGYKETKQSITIWRRQALTLAAALIAAAQYVEERLPEDPADVKQ
jgi:hypothetical protein